MRRALAIDEAVYGPEHPKVAIRLNNLAQLLQDTNRLAEAEPLSRRMVGVFLDFTRRTGHEHLHLCTVLANYAGILEAMGRSKPKIQAQLRALQADYGVKME
jgi:Tetratricopeptide repeat